MPESRHKSQDASAEAESATRQGFFEEVLNQLPRRRKQAIALLADFIALPLALWSALALRLGEWSPDVAQFWPAFVVSALVCIPVFGGLGLYRHVVRHMGNHAMLAVVQGATITAIAVATVAYMVPLRGFPRSVPIIFWLLALLYVSGSRFAIRAYFQWLQDKLHTRYSVIIYGAGSKGVELAKLLQQQGEYVPVAFIDDAKNLHRRIINGLYVYDPQDLEKLLKDTDARQVLVAVDASAADDRRRIIEFLEPFGVRVRLIPDFTELVSGQQILTNIRDVEIEDLIGRHQVKPLPHLLAGSVAGRNVMVTGAGGSIGSELCRQIIRQRPRLLALLDQSEFGLFQAQRELQAINAKESLGVPLVTVLGSVTNSTLMLRTLANNKVQTLYHAAAYKHVDLVEHNVIQGLKNNTFGTLHAAEAAMDAGVSDFILISTDKAVRTSSVMGASKRLAEMTLQALQEISETTRFSMVRFGNVLGSSGSVVPLFLEQIDRGGPVTVTHPDVTRYFMTIPEAAQLVLQAASMAKGGDVFLLDMGEPIKILEMARQMIRLKGYTVRDRAHPDGDIEIEISGLKAGEKLHEELLLGDAVTGTEHRKIMRAEEDYVHWAELRGALNTLEQACDDYDYEAIKTFIEGLVEGADLASQLGGLRHEAQVVSLNPKPRDTQR
jgi:FlaA1/EpsC-like NDP-sugar epimerase